MKVIIENGIERATSTKSLALVEIINAITPAQTEEGLRIRLRAAFRQSYVEGNFRYGFGHNHAWVMDVESKKRVLLIEF